MEVVYAEKYRQFYIYRDALRYYIYCVNKDQDYCRILEIDRTTVYNTS